MNLEGEVPRSSIVTAAVKTARHIEGVDRVVSELEIETLPWPVAIPPRYGATAPYFGPPWSPRAFQQAGLGHESAIDEDETTISGKVTGIDRGNETITVQTASGHMTLPLPAEKLTNGDRVEIEMAVREIGEGDAATP